ncbi:MAG: heme exporter protein CcmB, partial [Bdellovibrionales bacterium]|nr:heme exporter protein CcmB [Bdellovibrionales bacterium]
MALKPLLRKDVRSVWNNRSLLAATIGLSVLMVVVASFAFRNPLYDNEQLLRMTPGILWLIFVFVSVGALNQAFLPEHEERAIDGLVLSPIDPASVFISKCF